VLQADDLLEGRDLCVVVHLHQCLIGQLISSV
jgi:hypothetical protein